MRKVIAALAVVGALGVFARPATAQEAGTTMTLAAATTHASGGMSGASMGLVMGPEAWCKKCVEPGVCTGTGSGEWGWTICYGLGNDQCAAGGNACWWQTGGYNAVQESILLADGESHTLTPLAEFVLAASTCEDGSLMVVQGVTGAIARVDAGDNAWASMTLASR